jgi:hypothetical protein
VERGHPAFRDRITLQTYHKLTLFRPKELMETIQGVPVMMIIPELDNISSPAEQQDAFERMTTTKDLCLAKDKGHLSILTRWRYFRKYQMSLGPFWRVRLGSHSIEIESYDIAKIIILENLERLMDTYFHFPAPFVHKSMLCDR